MARSPSPRAATGRARLKRPSLARVNPSSEQSLLITATLALFAFGAVMVYSASSASSALSASGDPTYYLKRYLLIGAVGWLALRYCSRVDLERVRRATPALLIGAFVLLLIVMLPHVGVTANGARRWLGVGPFRFQPSEVAKLALVLYAAMLIAKRPDRVRSLATLANPLLYVCGGVLVLVAAQPDLGTDMVICFTLGAILMASGARLQDLAKLAAGLGLLVLFFSVIEPYRMARLTAFLHPGSDSAATGFQAEQARIAIGSGGFFGRGLGESVQKVFYLPEAHTDMILAVIGEELGMIGIAGLVSMYFAVAFAGLRAAKNSRDIYARLLAIGITSLIICQALLNFFAVLGLAPLTGVPLPFISYGNSNLIVLMASMGLLINVASGSHAARIRVVGGRERTAARAQAREPDDADGPIAARRLGSAHEPLDRLESDVARRARLTDRRDRRERTGRSRAAPSSRRRPPGHGR